MRYLLILLLSFGMLSAFIGCSSSQTEEDQDIIEATEDNADMAEDGSSDVDDDDDDSGEGDSGEDEEYADEDEGEGDGEEADDDGEEKFADEGENEPLEEEEYAEEDEAPPPEELEFEEEQAQEEPPSPMEEGELGVAETGNLGGEMVTVTGVDFKANENGGTFVIKTTGQAQYSLRQNSGRQYVLEMANTNLPAQFQRPFHTKEFATGFGSVSGYQKPNNSVARFVLQMKSDTEPTIQQDGNVLLVMAPGGVVAPETAEVDEQQPAYDENEGLEEGSGEMEPAVVGEYDEQKVLQGKNLDEFLMGETKFYGRRISIEVKDADIRDVFNFISEESGLNLVLSEQVAGRITLKLRQIPWDQALIVIMQTKGLGYIRQGNILRIAPLKEIRAETEATREVMEAQKQVQPLKVKIFPLSYAKAKDLEGQVREFNSQRGKVKADERINALVVTDIAENLAKISTLLKTLDLQTPQVLVEAKIVEARESFSKSVGVQWRANPPTFIEGGGVDGSSMSGVAVGQNSNLNDIEIKPFINFTPNINSSSAFGFALGTLDMVGSIDATLALLETDEKIKVLSSPRIVTMDNKEASVEQVTQIPIYSVTTTETSIERSVTFKDVKLQLVVTPHITAEGGIIMEIDLLREIAGPVDAQGGDTRARPIFTRKAKTSILVDNGQTAVIGGIYQNDVTNSESGVPFLRKIPLIGGLFRARDKTREKTELLIFLTPRVLNKDKAFGSDIPIAGNDGGGSMDEATDVADPEVMDDEEELMEDEDEEEFEVE
jgi:type IV pilus assembly protein PilQ